MKPLLVSLSTAIAFTLTAAADAQDARRAHDEQPPTASEKVQAALMKCGSFHIDVSAMNRKAALVAMDALKKKGSLPDRLALAGKEVAAKVPDAEYFAIRIPPAKDLNLQQLQSLLGKESGTAKGEFVVLSATGVPERLPVTWYSYEKYGFGASPSGDIIGIKVHVQEFREKGEEPKK